MGESQRIGMERADKPQLVLLPRDPEHAYIYWEWPGADANQGASARLIMSVEDAPGSYSEVHRFDVSDPMGGRFLSFARPGANHRCQLTWSDEDLHSDVVSAPRREAGADSAAFVQVSWTESRGLAIEPTEHEHFTHGRFPAARVAPAKVGSHSVPGSHSLSKRSE